MSSGEASVRVQRPAAPAFLAALVAPEAAMERVARSGRLRWTLGAALACSLLAGAAASLRVDARDSTLAALDKSGELKTMSDKQVDDAQKERERAFEVGRLAAAAVAPEVSLGLSLAGLLIVSWFLRGKPRAAALFAVAGEALLPFALADLLDAASALRHAAVPPEVGQHLAPRTAADFAAALGHPLAGAGARLGGAFDVYGLWAALLLGYGLASAASLPPRRAVPAALAGWLLFRLFVHVGLPTPAGG